MLEAGRGFVALGLGKFLGDYQYADSPVSQAAHGNLCIGVELLIKGRLAEIDPFLIFRELPVEQAATLASTVDESGAVVERVVHGFMDERIKTIDFERAVELFIHLEKIAGESLASHLRLMRRARNVSIHFFLPRFSGFEVQRAAFVAISIRKLVATLPDSSFFTEKNEAATSEKNFLDSFKNELIEKVERQLREARKRAAELRGPRKQLLADEDSVVFKCPICGSDGLGTGSWDKDEERGNDLFWVDEFLCQECNLHLESSDELQAAGMSVLEVF